VTDLLDLAGQRVLLTGGAGAIGVVITRVLAEHRASVVINDVIAEDEAATRLAGVRIAGYVRADTTDEAAVEGLLDDAERLAGGPIDTVGCHAGMVESWPVVDYPADAFDKLMALNVRAAFLVAQAAARRWQAHSSSGHVIFTSSWVQDVPWPEIAPYNVSKAAVRQLMRSMARELAPSIRANAIAPGIVAVGLAKRQWDSDESYRERAQRAIPLGSMQPAESVAHAFLFLCSAMASYMTGSVLLVDGGASLYPMDE
jgi:NAD(P)-dependent dehydrogenase (short-subunit alcohol dehydrogenase family)